jgi:hypothetical protein
MPKNLQMARCAKVTDLSAQRQENKICVNTLSVRFNRKGAIAAAPFEIVAVIT